MTLQPYISIPHNQQSAYKNEKTQIHQSRRAVGKVNEFH